METIILLIGNFKIALLVANQKEIEPNYLPFLTQITPTHWIDYKDFDITPCNIFYDKIHNVYVGKSLSDEEIIESRIFTPIRRVLFYDYNHAIHNQKQFFLHPILFLNTLIRFFFKTGIFLHAFSGIFKEKGYVFCGYSEAGKTTLAKKWLSHNLEVISDERILIIRKNNKFCVYSTPWPGTLGIVNNISAPLHILFLLRTEGPTLEPVTQSSDFTKYMLTQTYHRPWDVSFTAFLLSFLDELYRQIPVFWVNRNLIENPHSFFEKAEKVISENCRFN